MRDVLVKQTTAINTRENVTNFNARTVSKSLTKGNVKNAPVFSIRVQEKIVQKAKDALPVHILIQERAKGN